MRFEIYHALKGWRWRLIGRNDKILGSGEPYLSKSNCVRAINRMKQDVPDAEVKTIKAKI